MVRSLSAAVVALTMLLGLAVPSSTDRVADQASAMATAMSMQQAQGESVLADDVADVSVAPAAYMMTDDPWDNAAARFIAWAGGCANVSITSWTAYLHFS